MEVEYKVHNVLVVPHQTDVVFEGKKLRGTIDAVEVELVSSDGRHGSLTLRFTGGAADEAKSVFENDGDVTVSFTKSKLKAHKAA